jgi:hypothetical protein
MGALDGLWVRAQFQRQGLAAAQKVVDLLSALRQAQRGGYCAISARAWNTRAEAELGAEPCYYLPIFDFDKTEAVVDCESFCSVYLSGKYGLTRGVDFVVCESSPNKRKVFFLGWLPCSEGWQGACSLFSKNLSEEYKSLDYQMASKGTARFIFSEHREKAGVWQNPCQPAEQGACLNNISMVDRSLLFSKFFIYDKAPAFALAWKAESDFDKLVLSTPNKVQNAAKWRNVDYSAALLAAKVPHKIKTYKGAEWLRLAVCPVCGRKDGSPAISPKGWLNCLRSSCSANGGIPPTLLEGGKGGLDVGWARRVGVDPARVAARRAPAPRGLLRCQRSADARAERLEDARALLAEAIAKGLESRKPTIIKATPGSGKSHAILQAIAEQKNKSFLLLAPTRELAEEQTRALQLAGVEVVQLQGRQTGNCAYLSKVNAAARNGYLAGVSICPKCPLRKGCAYYSKLEEAAKARVVVSVWEHLYLVDAKWLKPNVIIMDEFPARTFVDKIEVGVSELMKWFDNETISEGLRNAARLLANALSDIETKIVGNKNIVHGKSWRQLSEIKTILGKAGGGWNRALLTLRAGVVEASAALEIEAGALSQMELDAIKELPSLNVPRLILYLDSVLRQKENTVINVYPFAEVERSGWRLCKLADLASRPNLVLDAYANKSIYDDLLGMETDIIEIEAQVDCRVWQVPISTSKEAIKNRGEGIRKKVEIALDNLRKIGHERILLICHKEETLFYEGLSVDLRYFGQGFGSNKYRHTHSAALVVGTPRANGESIEDFAAALWAGRPNYVAELTEDGFSYKDKRLSDLLETTRNDELAQGIHRIGLALPSDKPKDVVIFGRAELPALPPPFELEPRALFMAHKIAEFCSRFGFWGSFMVPLVNPSVFATEGNSAAERALAERAAEFGRAGLPFLGKRHLPAEEGSIDLGSIWGDEGAALEMARALRAELGAYSGGAAFLGASLAGRRLGLLSPSEEKSAEPQKRS